MAQSNNIQLITKYSPEAWDTVYKQESMSSLLDANPKLVRFTGAKTVKIGKWQNGGLFDYYRNNTGDPRVVNSGMAGVAAGTIDGAAANVPYDNFVGASGFGYQRSPAQLVWEEFTMQCDRAAAFQIEKFDNEESGEQLVGLGVTEISRTAIVPEVDAYCFSKIASFCSKALGNLVEEDITTTPLAKLNNCFLWFANHEVPIKDQLVFVAPSYMKSLRETQEVMKFLGQTDFNNKDINFVITTYEGRKLVEVSPERFRTDVVLYPGGYTWANTSRPINFLAVSKEAVTHVVKYEKVKVIGDDLNLAGNGFDGYTIYARIYHDVFVPDNKRIALYCSVAATDSYAGRKVEVEINASKAITKLGYLPQDKMVMFGWAAETDDKAPVQGGSVPQSITTAAVGTTLSGATTTKAVYVYAYDASGILAVEKVIDKTA